MTTTAPPNLLTKYQDYINEDDNNFDSNNVSKKTVFDQSRDSENEEKSVFGNSHRLFDTYLKYFF